MQAQPDAADAGLARGLLGSYAADAAPQQYLDSFDALLQFVDVSLDLYKVRSCVCVCVCVCVRACALAAVNA